jgi:acylphosphatase
MVNSETNSNMFSLHAIAHGQVQGVSYRAFIFEKARLLELTGFVRNLPSFEDVEIQAEGRKENLEKLLIYINQGPTTAMVDNVTVNWSGPVNKYTSFVILRS